MPDYTVRDPRTGRSLTMRGPQPPTGDQIRRAFAQLPQAAAPPQMPPGAIDPNMAAPSRVTDQAPVSARDLAVRQALDLSQGRNTTDVVGGMRALHASTVYQGGDLLRRGWNAIVPERFEMDRIINEPDVQAAMTAPDSTAGRAGQMVGTAAEFAVPLRRVATAMRGASLLRRAGADALASGAVAGVQSGGDGGDMAMAAAGGAVVPFVGAAARGLGRTAQRAAAGAEDGGFGGAIAGAVRSAAPSDPRTLLIQALKPRSTRTNFPSTLYRAMPEIKAAESAIGRPVSNLEDLFEATTAAKQRLQQQLGILRGNTRGFQVDLTPVADAMEAAIPKKLQLESPDAALRLQAAARVYRRPFEIDEAEALLRETNAELDSFYTQYPRAQQSALASNPGAATLNAQAKALRSAIYQTLDAPGQGTAARELNRRYGSLLEVEGEAYRRLNVARRQQPESLSEQIGAVRAAADMARGTWRVLHGDLTGAADIAAATAGRSTAKAIKDSQTTDALIRRAFQGYRGQPAPVQMPPQRTVRGLLPRGPLVTPPPDDPSFARGVPADYARREVRGLLPEGQSQPAAPPSARRVFAMPGEVAPDASRVGSVRAAPIAYDIDPTVTVKAGGFRVAQFAGDPAAARAAVATPEVRAMLERMADDLDTFKPQRGRLVPGRHSESGEGYYSYGAAGSPVGDDIRVISEQNVGNLDVAGAIADLLAWKTPTNRLHTAALDAAMGYLERRPGYRGPSVPTRGASAQTDDGFDAFSRAVDDIAGDR